MTHNIADVTTLFEGRLRVDGKQCAEAIDYVAVNGFCTSDREPWTLQERFWLEDWLKQNETRVLLVGNRLNANSSFEDLLHEGENLLRAVEKYRSSTDIPLIFHCFGLGGIILLKALSLSEGRNGRRKLALTTAGVVFYGTPIHLQSPSKLTKTLWGCFTTELQLERQPERVIRNQAIAEIQELLKSLEVCDFEILSIFEKEETTWKCQRSFGPKQRRKILVPEALAKVKSSICIGLNRDHTSIAKLDRLSYATIFQHLRRMVDRYQNSSLGGTTPRDQTFIPAPIDSHIFTNTGSSQTLVTTIRQNTAVPTIVPEAPPRVVETSDTTPLNLPCHKIDFPQNTKFVGRNDILHELHQGLVQGKETQTPSRAFVIFGTAGMGKTQTALEFAYQHKDNFPSILWASSETRYKLLQSLSGYSHLLGLIDKPSDPASDAESLMQWYRTTDTPWLLIFDNAVDIRLILDYWPRSAVGAILITTQKPSFVGPDRCEKGQELLQLDEESAITLLKSSLRNKATEGDDARIIVKRVGCLPVAIRTCIGQINEADCSLEEYNKQWSDARQIISQADVKYVESFNARYDKGLRELWAHSFEALNADARALINILSLLDDEHIPEELLKIDSLYEKLPFLKNRVRAIRDLAESSLIAREVESQQTAKRFHIHRMTRTFAQMQMTRESQQEAFDAAALLLNEAVIRVKSATDNERVRIYFQHVQALYEFYESTATPEAHYEVLIVPIAFVKLLLKMCWWCYRMNFFGPGLSFIKTIRKIHDDPQQRPLAVGDGELLEVEMVWTNYQHGAILTELGDFQGSYECFSAALECRVSAVEKGYGGLLMPREFAILGGLGNAYNGLGRQIESERYFKKALELQPEDVVFDVFETAICKSLWLQGQPRLAEASERLEKFIKKREEWYGEDDTKDFMSGEAFYILGNVRKSQAEDPSITAEQRQQWLDESYNYHSRSLKVWKITHGEEHHHTADAGLRLAWHLMQRGNNDRAVNLLKRALTVYKSPSNREYRRPEVARTTFMLSLAYENAGNVEMAREFRDVAEKTRKDILKENYHPPVGLESYNNLVSLWQL